MADTADTSMLPGVLHQPKFRLSGVDSMFAQGRLMLCDAGQFLFTYIPKNACTSVKAAILRNDFPDVVAKYESESAFLANVHKHDALLMAKNSSDFARYDTTLLVLRNPVKRAISAYQNKFILHPEPAIIDPVGRAFGCDPNEVTFEQFIDYVSQTPGIWLDAHFRPQADFLLFEEYSDVFAMEDREGLAGFFETHLGVILPTANASARRMEVLFSDECYKRPAKFFAANPDDPLPAFGAYLTPNIVAKIAERYQDDIDLYLSLARCPDAEYIDNTKVSASRALRSAKARPPREIERLRQSERELQTEIEESRRSLAVAQNETASLLSERDRLSELYRDLADRHELQAFEFRQLRDQHDLLRKERDTLNRDLETAVGERAALGNRLSLVTRERDALAAESLDNTAIASRLRDELNRAHLIARDGDERLRAEVVKSERQVETIASLQAQQSRSDEVRAEVEKNLRVARQHIEQLFLRVEAYKSEVGILRNAERVLLDRIAALSSALEERLRELELVKRMLPPLLLRFMRKIQRD